VIPDARYERLFPKIASPKPDPRGWQGGEADVLARAETEGYIYGLEDFDPDGEHLLDDNLDPDCPEPWPEMRAAYLRGWARGKADADKHGATGR
jgi:ribosome modulation factor